MKQKQDKVLMATFWTNAAVDFKEQLFSHAALSVIDGASQIYNCVDTNMCTARRHDACVEKGECDRYRPHSQWDMLRMVGKKCIGGTVTQKDMQKIHRMLYDSMRRCREVHMILTDYPHTVAIIRGKAILFDTTPVKKGKHATKR